MIDSGFGSAGRARLARRSVSLGVAAMLLGASTTASAVEFEVGPFEGSVQSLITFGAAWRMQDRASRLIGKSNLEPGICVTRDPDGTLGGGRLGPDSSCSTSNFEENLA